MSRHYDTVNWDDSWDEYLDQYDPDDDGTNVTHAWCKLHAEKMVECLHKRWPGLEFAAREGPDAWSIYVRRPGGRRVSDEQSAKLYRSGSYYRQKVESQYPEPLKQVMEARELRIAKEMREPPYAYPQQGWGCLVVAAVLLATLVLSVI